MTPHRAISPPSPLGRRATHVLAAVTLLACGPPTSAGDDVGDDVGSEVTGVEPSDNPLCVAPEEPTLARFGCPQF